VDANQKELRNPFGMDTDCENCPELCGPATGSFTVTATWVVSFSSSVRGRVRPPRPTVSPFTGAGAGERVQSIFADLGFVRSAPDATEPDVQNIFFTNLTRCRHPKREPTDREVETCEPFLNAEIRMINPQIIVPVGERPLRELAVAYTTRRPDSFDIDAEHATTIRGRGFELVPMKEPSEMTDTEADAFREHMRENVLSRDYRQTKGRQSR